MKFKRNVAFLAILTILTISAMSSETLAQMRATDSNDLLNQLLSNSVEGVWNLNIEESDDPIGKIQALIQKSVASPENAEVVEEIKTPGVSISILPPERLVLLGSEDEMTINEFFPDVVSTRTLITDGQLHVYQADKAELAVNAAAIENKLSIETLSPRGNHMIETFELSADGNKLRVTIRISDSNFQELLTLNRVYDRAILDDFSDYSDD